MDYVNMVDTEKTAVPFARDLECEICGNDPIDTIQ